MKSKNEQTLNILIFISPVVVPGKAAFKPLFLIRYAGEMQYIVFHPCFFACFTVYDVDLST